MIELNKIYLIDVIDGLKQIDSNTADIVLIDPPYNIGKNFGNNNDDMEFSKYLEWCDGFILESIRILKDTGTVFIYGFSEILAHISARLQLEHRWLIWHYTNKAVPSSEFWQRSHESIIVGWKDKTKRIFNKDDVREPYTEIFLKNASGKIRRSTRGRYSRGDKETIYTAHGNGALPRDVLKIQDIEDSDVIKISALAGGSGNKERWFLCKTCNGVFLPNDKLHIGHDIVKHPTQKPMALTNKLFLSAKPKENGCVVIPFSGSGSEAVVAKKLGMSFIGFDINEDYVIMSNYIVNYIENITI
jgi:site-specific DNA-methyltransferase (adenine-specific)